MGIKYANNASSQIIAALSTTDTAVPVATGQGNLFPVLGVGDWFIATLVNSMNQFEIVKVTARSGDVMTIVRAQEGTSAKAFAIGSRIELRLTAGAFDSIIQDIRDQAATQISAALDSIISIGSMLIMPGNYIPPNFVRPNGAILSRALYPRLWDFANSQSSNIVNDADWSAQTGSFSRGDGSTTFRIPDMRGEFIRFWDEGRGVDAGRLFGSVQSSQNKSHVHAATDSGHAHSINDPGHAHSINDPGHQHSSETRVGGLVDINFAGSVFGPTGLTGPSTTGISIVNNPTGISVLTSYSAIVVASEGGIEARPRNLAYLPIMRYQ